MAGVSRAVLRRMSLLRRGLVLAIAMMFLVGCCEHHGIVVGYKDFPEQALLAEILAQHLERKLALTVERSNKENTYGCNKALLVGCIDLYPEYTGSALAMLGEKRPGSPDEVYQRVKDEYHRHFAVEVTPRLGFNNSFALVVRREDAQKLHLRTISDLARCAPQWRMVMGHEFLQRADGFTGLANTYGLRFTEQPKLADLGSIYSYVEKQVVVVGSSTDSAIKMRDLIPLEDDKHYFPPYEAIVVVREKALTDYPGLREALGDLAGKISENDIRQLNFEMESKHQDIKQLVARFLREKGL